MTLLNPSIHKYVLPVGFAIIIFLMVTSTLMGASRMKSTRDTILTGQVRVNDLNASLDKMSSANLERSHIIFKLVQSSNSENINSYIKELYNESINFNNARAEYIALNPPQGESEMLSLQAVMTIENIRTINEVIKALENNNITEASNLVNNWVLPRNKHILKLIEGFHNAATENAYTRIEAAKVLSAETHKSIITIKAITILLTLFLMIFLVRKQRKSDKDLSFLASTDTLTKLPNRPSFIRDIEQTIKETKESNSIFSIVFLDIDYFKSINDNYGHEVGDIVLNHFSSTIKNEISSGDTLARFGGDEFVLLLKDIKNEDDANRIVERLSEALDTSYLINNNEIFVSASMGASTFPNDGLDAKSLLKNADIAMYTAKESGRNCFQFYSLKNSQKLEYEHTLTHALQTVLKNNNATNELSLVYQPLVNIDDEQFYECEALIRWHDRNGNKINTAEFIEIAEKSNLIEKVNLFVIEQACIQQNEWQKQGFDNIRININLSGNKRIFNNLFKSLTDNVKRYNLDPKLFGIELTERTMYEVSHETIKELDNFRTLGMKIAIDDFGTGYSSLSYIKDLPITSLKIDRKFIAGLPNEKIDVALVKTIITLAHSLDLDVVAEGVETQEQFDFLKSSKCNIAQGFLLHRPLSSEGISQLKLVA